MGCRLCDSPLQLRQPEVGQTPNARPHEHVSDQAQISAATRAVSRFLPSTGMASSLFGACPIGKTIAAYAAAPGHVVDVLLVEGKKPAGFGPAFAVHAAQTVLFCYPDNLHPPQRAALCALCSASSRPHFPAHFALPAQLAPVSPNFKFRRIQRILLKSNTIYANLAFKIIQNHSTY